MWKPRKDRSQIRGFDPKMRPIGTDCTYDESGSKVTLTCGPQSMMLTIDSDGNLNGPPESIGKLVKKK
jgi:hypothetical protein